MQIPVYTTIWNLKVETLAWSQVLVLKLAKTLVKNLRVVPFSPSILWHVFLKIVMWKFIGNLVSYLEQQTKHVVSDIKRQSNFDYHCCMSAIIYVLLENIFRIAKFKWKTNPYSLTLISFMHVVAQFPLFCLIFKIDRQQNCVPFMIFHPFFLSARSIRALIYLAFQ